MMNFLQLMFKLPVNCFLCLADISVLPYIIFRASAAISELINLHIKADIWSVIFYADPVEGSTTVAHLLSFALLMSDDSKKKMLTIYCKNTRLHTPYVHFHTLLQLN